MKSFHPNTVSVHEDTGEGFALLPILKALLERAWLILLLVLLCTGAAYYYIVNEEVLYSSKAIVQLEQREPTAIGGGGAQDVGDLRAAELLKTVEQNLLTDDLFLRLVETNKLAEDPGFLEHKDGVPPGKQKLARLLASRTTVKARRGTRLIDITIEDTDPARAQVLAKSLIQESVRQQYELRAGGSAVANEFLTQEAERLKKNLEQSEYQLQRYKEDNNAVSLEERQNITVEKLRELNLNVTVAKNVRLRLESDLALSKSYGDKADALLSIPSIANASEVLDAKRKITDQEALLANLRERYLPKHPKFIQGVSQLEELREGVKRAAILAADRLQNEWSIAKATEEKIEGSLADQEKAALALNKLAVQYKILARQVQSDLTMYQSVMQRMGETELAKGFTQSIFRVVQWPLLPTSPSWPKSTLILILAAFAGVVLGSGCILLLNLMDTSIRNPEQAEALTGFEVHGAIPIIDPTTTGARSPSPIAKFLRYAMPHFLGKKLPASSSLFVLLHPQSAVAEAVRSLRASILLVFSKMEKSQAEDAKESSGDPKPNDRAKDPARVILFTSALASEGKSFCGANFATSLAQAGFRTLLVDADLRRPMVGAFFELPGTNPGLGQIFNGTSAETCIRTTPTDGLLVLQAGHGIDNPSEAFSGPKMKNLLQELKSQFDWIVIDSAPVNAVSDTLLISNLADAVCLVIMAAKTSATSVRRALESLRKSGAKVSGVILNRMPASSGLNYNYYYSSNS